MVSMSLPSPSAMARGLCTGNMMAIIANCTRSAKYRPQRHHEKREFPLAASWTRKNRIHDARCFAHYSHQVPRNAHPEPSSSVASLSFIRVQRYKSARSHPDMLTAAQMASIRIRCKQVATKKRSKKCGGCALPWSSSHPRHLYGKYFNARLLGWCMATATKRHGEKLARRTAKEDIPNAVHTGL